MKKIIVTTAVLILGIYFNSYAWNKIYSETTGALNAVYFTDTQTGYTVGNSGKILKTTDGGNTWISQISGTTIPLYSVYFVNSNVGYAVGGITGAAVILKTIDGGSNWVQQVSGVSTKLKSVFFTDANNGYVVGGVGLILKTVDGGITWTNSIIGNTPRQLFSVFFANNLKGIVVGIFGTILKTEDAGITWTEEISGTTNTLNSVHFVNSNVGYIGGQGVCLKTIDGGVTWTVYLTITSTLSNIKTIYFTDNLVGYAANGTVFKTIDGGVNWTEQATPRYSANAVHFVNDTLGYAVGNYNTIYKTTIAGGYPNSDFISINNIKAKIYNEGSLFWDKNTQMASFEVPNGSGKQASNASAIWIGGRDDYGQLHVAGQRYSNGEDFFPGPIMDSISYKNEQEKWNRTWKVSKQEIEYHMAHWFDPAYIMPEVIANWPGNCYTCGWSGSNFIMAPFGDVNEDGIYSPQSGDYPWIKGDQAVYFIFNDNMGTHTETGGNKLGVEVHAMAYAFNCPSDSAFWNTIFINYQIINLSTYKYDSTFVGYWTDSDLGDAYDDYIECDVKRGSFYGFNGDADDGGGMGATYGTHPPALSCTILGGPYMGIGGSANYDDLNGCDESINGLNFNDGIIDNERLGMSRFMYFQNDGSVLSDPATALQYYNMLSGHWKDGTRMTYGGTGYQLSGGVPANFAYPGNPTTDSCAWGTGGVVQPGWSIQGNPLKDYRGVASSGPYTMMQGSVHELDLAFVFGRDYVNPSPLAGVDVMKQRIDVIRDGFINQMSPCGTFNQGVKENIIKEEISLFPNPASSYFDVKLENNNNLKTIEIFTAEGVFVKQEQFTGNQTRILTNNLSSGLYVVKIETKLGSQFKKVIVVK